MRGALLGALIIQPSTEATDAVTGCRDRSESSSRPLAPPRLMLEEAHRKRLAVGFLIRQGLLL